jgi:hypothetical protein
LDENKVILYYCAFGESYLSEAIVSINSFRNIGMYHGKIHIFIYAESVSENLLSKFQELNVQYHIVKGNDIPQKDFEKASFRYRVLNYLDAPDCWLIYSDCDVLAIQPLDLNSLIEMCDRDKINVRRYLNRIQNGEWQAAFYTDDAQIVNQPASGSGFLVYKSGFKSVFLEFMSEYDLLQQNGPSWDQAFFNYYFLRRNLLNITFDKLFLEERDPNYNSSNAVDAVFLDYLGLRGLERASHMRSKYLEVRAQALKNNHKSNSVIRSTRLELSEYLMDVLENRISYGPFCGVKLFANSTWGPGDRASMLLGLYEKEVLSTLISLLEFRDNLINIGAGDGYFPIGLLTNGYIANSLCYEQSVESRENLIRAANLNGVTDSIVLREEAFLGFELEISKEYLANSVLIMDIEGGEFSILNSDSFQNLRLTPIIIEIHNFVDNAHDLRARLIGDSKATHNSYSITQTSRDLSSFPEVRLLSDSHRWLIASEGRSRLPEWIVFTPILSSSKNN